MIKLQSAFKTGIWVIAIISSLFLFSCSNRNEESGIESTLLWARLEPLPVSATEIDLVVNGSSFTREFQLTFVAEKEDIEKWLLISDGTEDFALTSSKNRTQHFQIEPGGGAQFAELTVDWEINQVIVRTYWS